MLYPILPNNHCCPVLIIHIQYQLENQSLQVSQTLVQYWTQFARTGDPNSPTGAGVRWEAVSSTQPAYLALAGPQPQMDYPTQYAASHEFWRTVYFRPSALETPLGSIQGPWSCLILRCINRLA